ncbi:MAG: hypothetical protein E7102_02870 [Prevotella ruminicola]|uniref:Transglutaminase-like superfamily protein n=1 Tax=Xylanibacter ruminicola TaxID=839 RepID=A0A928BRW7_XYLRU|nr:hypothetical protein [Xylanibacter ruminicola]
MRKLSLTLLIMIMFIGMTYAQGQRPQRQRGSLKQQVQSKQKMNYDDFVNDANKKYEEFRDSVNKKYADFMEKAWKDYPIEDAVDRPKEDDIKPIEYDKMTDEDYLEDMKRQEEERKLAEAQKKREEEQARLAEEKKKQEEEQARLAAEQKQREEEQARLLEEQKKQEEEQARIAAEKKKQEEEKARILAEKKKQQEEKAKLLAEQKKQQDELKRLAALKKQQEEQQKQLEKQQKKEELAKLLAEKKKQEEQEKLALQKQKEQERQQKLLEEQQRKQEEQARLLEEKLKKQEEQQRLLEEKKKQQEEKARLLAEKKKQQEEQKRLLAEQKKKQEEEQARLAAEKKKQEEQERQLAEQKKKQQEKQSKPIEAVVVPVVLTVPPQPKPVNPIVENKVSMATSDFDFYGTPMKVRWGNAEKFKLNGTSKKDISDAFLELTDKGYTNLVHDCLELRKEYKLCDWAYYKMLQNIAEKACGKGTNEAIFLQGVLLNQSGYQIRFALEDNTKLHIMSRMDGFPYDRGYLTADGKLFFLMDGCKAKNLTVCDAAYPGEQMMSLGVAEQPDLKKELSDKRTVISRFVNVSADMQMNKNLMDFYTDYPTSYDGKDMMTRWAYYANTPVAAEVKDKVYPQLKQQIGNAPKLMAANMLLNWVQMGLTYAYDEKVWGHDRAFFAEESLFYPFCDCEDRSILFSHLIRDLLDLDVVLVYYPGHLYTAVCFNEDVTGDYIMVNGRKFTVADPTYYNANVGKTMSKMDNSKAKVILLKR